MTEETWTLFPFLTMDYKAAEGWLNQKSAQGWQYTSKTTLWGYLFRLRRTERTDLRYCVDISGGKKDQDYRNFLNQAGWGWEGTVRGEEVGLDYARYAMDSVHTGTPLVNRWEYLELVDCDSTWSLFLYTRRYHCLWEGLAVRTARALMEDEPFTPVELGFDESWIFLPDPPDDYSVLVLREGNTAVRLEGPLDWTDEAVRGILKEKFG